MRGYPTIPHPQRLKPSTLENAHEWEWTSVNTSAIFGRLAWLERFRIRRNHTKEHALRCASSTGSEKVGIALVLQLCFSLTAVVSGCRFSLVPSSPERPGHDEASSDGWPEQNTGQKIADLGHGR